jgi:hypothetical protein
VENLVKAFRATLRGKDPRGARVILSSVFHQLVTFRDAPHVVAIIREVVALVRIVHQIVEVVRTVRVAVNVFPVVSAKQRSESAVEKPCF